LESDLKKIYLKDYQSPDFVITNTNLEFDIYDDHVTVTSQIQFQKKTNANDLVLNGEKLELLEVKLNNVSCVYEKSDSSLVIRNTPDEFTLFVVVKINPYTNSDLEGLYDCKGILCTQCEAESFRRITYYLDRPDVLSKFQVKIIANKKKFPVLLSNGNCIEKVDTSDNRHYTVWQDPFPKASYLFALVAGDLGIIKDQFQTSSGKKVDLEIYSPHGTQHLCQHAMQSLKLAMKWDEDTYGLEYDLGQYMILAIDDFNSGAMENKGLNIFNSKYIYASPETTTDKEYFLIESVVAHEYFHNWTGNRVTLRDWFHLSLKEGLTVFRDQEFSMDMTSRSNQRVDIVSELRSRQFAEDASPNAHPIRPESCYSVSNFYTSTIYEKGAEIIRMMQTMVGRPGFKKGFTNYINKFDGKAVIIEDFAQAISEVNNQDWNQFKLWYSQAGTPKVTALTAYDHTKKKYSIQFEQTCLLTSNEKNEGKTKKPFHIPISISLFNKQGCDVTQKSSHPDFVKNSENNWIFHLKDEKSTLEWDSVPDHPIASINRDFSAPIHLETNLTDSDKIFLLEKDTNFFQRYEIAQKFYINFILKNYKENVFDKSLFENFIKAIQNNLQEPSVDFEIKAKLLQLPEPSYLLQFLDNINPEKLAQSITQLETMQSEFLYETAFVNYKKWHGHNETSTQSKDFGHRLFKNCCLKIITQSSKFDLALTQFQLSKNMTDKLTAASLLTSTDNQFTEEVLSKSFDQWKSFPQTLNHWYQIQAKSRSPKTLDRIRKIYTSDTFNHKNPNSIYNLLGVFGQNLFQFHDQNGLGYQFLAEHIETLDKQNPQVATYIAKSFLSITKMQNSLKTNGLSNVNELLKKSLSKNTFEILNNIAKS